MKTAVSLFTGCGGSDMGLHKAGFDVIMANDILPYAKDTYLHNLPETEYILEDIRKIKTFPQAELLVGCYPCQGFSQGGVRDPGRDINYLYREFARALAQVKPKAFIVENVSGMTRSNFRPILDDQIQRFSAVGYKVDWKLLNTADYGVAQERKRVIIVGIRNDIDNTFHYPPPVYGNDLEKAYQTIGDVISDLPEWPEGEFYDRDFHWYYMSRNRRRDWAEPARTIVSNPRHMPLHPISPKMVKVEHDVWKFENDEAARRFSYREAARLQGFDKDFSFPDTERKSLDMCYKVAGNAVPPPLFEAVANSLPDIW